LWHSVTIGHSLQWDLDGSGELDTIVEAAGIEDSVVGASDFSISLTAAAVIRAAGNGRSGLSVAGSLRGTPDVPPASSERTLCHCPRRHVELGGDR